MSRLMGILESLFSDTELPNKKLSEDEIVVRYNSDHTVLNTVFKVQSNDAGYEHYTKLIHEIPEKQQGSIAAEAITGDAPLRNIIPFLSETDSSLYLYGGEGELSEKSEVDIRSTILDVLGRNVAFDNEKRPGFNRIIKK